MSPIGHIAPSVDRNDALARGRLRAALIPDCLVEARRVANIVIAGWHGRRKRGIGDNFWQFRQYRDGESFSQIDWRKSARDEHLYVRDKEWETAHTIWLWVDLSNSMKFQSEMSDVSKESRALVILFALAEILCRSGERIGMPGIMAPILARNGAERLAQALISTQVSSESGNLPDMSPIKRLSDVILISDFLGDSEKIIEQVAQVSKRGTMGHLIEIADPAEEVFPYTGRVEFYDPETDMRLVAGKAASVAEDYVKAYKDRKIALSNQIRRLGWNMVNHRTDLPASSALGTLHGFLSGMKVNGSSGGGK